MWTNLSKKTGSRPKNVNELFFSGFSHITARRRFAILLFCSDYAQTHSIVVYLIRQVEPVIKWTTLSEKNRFWAKKLQRNGFLAFSHFTARKHLAILLFCSDYAQTYRIVAHFILEGEKTKISPQNSSHFLFTTSEISRVSRS